jgi:signal transduction histidine kinase
MLGCLSVVTTLTGLALLRSWQRGFIGLEELSEIPLMAGLFLVMVWHVNRRQASLRQVERMVAIETERAEALQLFVRQGSHELRTPITVARGFTELIRSAHADPQTAEDAGVILDELAKLERITARLLTLLVVDSALPMSVVDLDERMERIVRRWAPTAVRRWEVDTAVGSLAVNVDRFETALDSLLENAVKFTADGDLIGVYAARHAGEIVIEVRDSGRGIPPAEIPHVFEHFTTASNAADRAGTGLGLSIVRAAVAARGGTVHVASEVSGGTSFYLRIPEKPPRQPVALDRGALPNETVVARRSAADRPLSHL